MFNSYSFRFTFLAKLISSLSLAGYYSKDYILIKDVYNIINVINQELNTQAIT
jgi:hypothetical protein